MELRHPFPTAMLYAKATPENVRTNLIRAGLVLTAWELVENQVTGQTRHYFTFGFTWNGSWMDSSTYHANVLPRAKKDHTFDASLSWLVEAGAVDEDQEKTLRAFRDYRNKIGHEMPRLLLEDGEDIDMGRIVEIQEILMELGRFWISIDCRENPDILPAGGERHIHSGVELVMDYLVDTAQGTEAALKAKVSK
jgi:hypothetical protein